MPGLDPALLDELSAVDFGREGHGDLTTPVALRIGKLTHANPRAIAEQIAAALRSASGPLAGMIGRVEIAGPGFINIHLARAYWPTLIHDVLAEGPRYGRSGVGRSRKALLEFASANPTGPLTVASARQAALGDVLARILRYIGFDVATEYWVNDAGNQVQKLGESLLVRYLQALGDSSIEFPEDGYHGDYVVEMGRAIAAEEGRRYAEMPRDQAISELGQLATARILKSILADMERFGAAYTSIFSQRQFESGDNIQRLIDRMKQKGLTYEKDGAIWMKTQEHGDPEDRVLVKADGAWAYRLSDIAYHESKFERGFEWVIDLLGPDHHGHIITMQAAMKALGHPVQTVQFLIVQYCTILRGAEKVKMGKRTGAIITLDEVIDQVGVDVTRFFFLTRKTDSHLDFDLELATKQSLDNPVYYIQYAHARIASIIRKAQEKGAAGPADFTDGVYTSGTREDLAALEDRDLALAAKLGQFQAVLEKAGLDLAPHLLTNYLQELAAEFHNFYTQCTVIGDDKRLTRARLQLVSAVRIVLRNALHLLGVNIPEMM